MILRWGIWCSMLLAMLASTAFAQHCKRDDYVVAIDVGHSKAKSGAESARGTDEFLFNQTLARDVLTELRRRGFAKAFLINENGSSVSLIQRTQAARERSAQLFI